MRENASCKPLPSIPIAAARQSDENCFTLKQSDVPPYLTQSETKRPKTMKTSQFREVFPHVVFMISSKFRGHSPPERSYSDILR